MSTERRKPTWTICVNDAPQGAKPRWRSIGAVWSCESGNWFVKIEDGCELRGTAMMFPYREKPPGGGGGGGYRRPPTRTGPAEGDYMERKRLERSKAPQPPPPQPAEDDLPYDTNVEAPLAIGRKSLPGPFPLV